MTVDRYGCETWSLNIIIIIIIIIIILFPPVAGFISLLLVLAQQRSPLLTLQVSDRSTFRFKCEIFGNNFNK